MKKVGPKVTKNSIQAEIRNYIIFIFFNYTFVFITVISTQKEVVTNKATDFSYVSIIKYPEIKKSQGGEFECRGFREGSVDPKNITIKVLTMIPPTKDENFNMDERVLTPSKGENVKLDCSIKGGARPKPVITWMKDEKEINDQNNFTDAVKFSSDYSSITFRYIQADHSGEYQCEAVNRAGEVRGKLTLSK